MESNINLYFTAERQESLLFIVVGLLAIGVAAWLWMNGHRLRSMAYPLVAVALIQGMVGATVFLRTDKQMTQLSAQVAQAPAIFKQEEMQRMNVVMKNFGVYKVIEIALILIGIGLIAFLQRSDMATGIGAGLVLQSAFMLALDTFAEVRGNEYVAALQAFGA